MQHDLELSQLTPHTHLLGDAGVTEGGHDTDVRLGVEALLGRRKAVEVSKDVDTLTNRAGYLHVVTITTVNLASDTIGN